MLTEQSQDEITAVETAPVDLETESSDFPPVNSMFTTTTDFSHISVHICSLTKHFYFLLYTFYVFLLDIFNVLFFKMMCVEEPSDYFKFLLY